MYVAARGGERAIDEAHRQLAEDRRGDPSVPELTVDQIAGQLGFAVDRVMMEAGLHDPELAALAIKQAAGDLVEAVFLLRAYRNTLPRFGSSEPLATEQMTVRRRVSAAFKDVPGGQALGPTADFSLRLLDPALAGSAAAEAPPDAGGTAEIAEILPRVVDLLAAEGLIEAAGSAAAPQVADITRDPPAFPAGRDVRLQTLARGDEGFLLGLAYSTQRGYGTTHPFAGEIRMGDVVVSFTAPELGFAIEIGEITVTEATMINQFHGTADEPPRFTRGYGLVFGRSERKAMAAALIDRALSGRDLGETDPAAPLPPARDEEFVLSHCDNVEASGFVQHLKLPHHVDFQAELDLIRRLRREFAGKAQDRTR